ncbi:prolactin-inducible protein homolog [Monodelphis domestica]|uniref:prolactin-inducible protein homolog n=1 Tax=Monodelphis domestica TaxID=13616 RepID=UPI0004434A48|nr:prolactin-inducible protein homolog [Monodelphis domestica]
MPPLQALVRHGITALILGLCLQLVIGQNEQNRMPLIVSLAPIPDGKSMEPTEVTCSVSTELRECLPMKVSISSNKPLNCDPPPYDQEACICPEDLPRKFFFNVCSKGNVSLTCMAVAINEKNICEPGKGVFPINGFFYYHRRPYKVTT